VAGSFSAVGWRQYPRWVRGEARIVDQDVVLLGEHSTRTYYINEPDDLLPNLAGLYSLRGSPSKLNREVVRFVRRHGLLWHGPADVGTGQCREPLRAWLVASGKLAEAAAIYVRLMAAVVSGDATPLRDLVTIVDWASRFNREPQNDEEYLEQATVWVAELVSAGLRGCEHVVSAACGFRDPQGDGAPIGAPGVFLGDVHPPTLEAAAYLHLSDLMLSQVKLAECPGCGRPFNPRSGKQKYCTEACANTSRWRRWKEKQASLA
jgi:hypothetical protein